MQQPSTPPFGVDQRTWDNILVAIVITVLVLFCTGMAALSYEYLGLHMPGFEAPWEVAWGTVLTAIGALLREALSRSSRSS